MHRSTKAKSHTAHNNIKRVQRPTQPRKAMTKMTRRTMSSSPKFNVDISPERIAQIKADTEANAHLAPVTEYIKERNQAEAEMDSLISKEYVRIGQEVETANQLKDLARHIVQNYENGDEHGDVKYTPKKFHGDYETVGREYVDNLNKHKQDIIRKAEDAQEVEMELHNLDADGFHTHFMDGTPSSVLAKPAVPSFTHVRKAAIQMQSYREETEFPVSKRIVGPPGTVEEPTMVFSPKPYRIVGCVGLPDLPHPPAWFSMEGYIKHMCPHCAQVFQLTNNPDECNWEYIEKQDPMARFHNNH